MKNLFFLLLLFITFLNGFVAESQNNKRFPMLHERIVQAKLREIRFQLKLDQSTFNQFRPIYLRYENEISGIDFKDLTMLFKVDADSLSSEDADRLIVSQLESSQRLISIRKKYYTQFRTVISPQQIIKIYQTEAELRKKVIQEMKRRMISR